MIYKNSTGITGIYLNGHQIANGYKGQVQFFGQHQESSDIQVTVSGDGLIYSNLTVGMAYTVTYSLVDNTANRFFGGGQYVFAGDNTDYQNDIGPLTGTNNYYVSTSYEAGNNQTNYTGSFTFTAATTDLYVFWTLYTSDIHSFSSGTVTITELAAKQPLCFTSLEDGNVISFTKGSNVTKSIVLEYSNDGTNWSTWDYANDTISLDTNDKVYVRGVCPNGLCQSHTSSTSQAPTLTKISNFGFTGYTNASGSIMSLINRNPNEMTIPSANYFFENLFYNCTTLMTAPELPAINLYNYCYSYMFYNCTSLITAPALPATTLTDMCYQGMFRGCSSLINPPILNATTLTQNCYGHMFRDCTSLVNAPALPSTTLTSQCYSNMFNGCSSMITAPVLPAETLISQCYTSIFRGCSLLNNVTILALTNINSNNLTAWGYTTSQNLYGWAQTGTITLNENFDPDTLAEIRQTVNLIPDGWTYNKSTDPVVSYNSSTKTLSVTPSTSLLYVDGTQVSNPYTFNPMYNTNYTYYATNKENGNVMSKTGTESITVQGYKTPDPIVTFDDYNGVITVSGNGDLSLSVNNNLVQLDYNNSYTLPYEGNYSYAANAKEYDKEISNIVYGDISWTYPNCATPVISYNSSTKYVTITCATENSTIYYKIDNDNTVQYTGPFTFSTDGTYVVTAFAVAYRHNDSTATSTINHSSAAAVWAKVTDANDLANECEILIVDEAHGLVFNGSSYSTSKNGIAVTITNNTIEDSTDLESCIVTYNSASGYLKNVNDLYIGANSSGATWSSSSTAPTGSLQQTINITISNGTALIGNAANQRKLFFNTNNSSNGYDPTKNFYFRWYTESTANNAPAQYFPVQVYKKS